MSPFKLIHYLYYFFGYEKEFNLGDFITDIPVDNKGLIYPNGDIFFTMNQPNSSIEKSGTLNVAGLREIIHNSAVYSETLAKNPNFQVSLAIAGGASLLLAVAAVNHLWKKYHEATPKYATRNRHFVPIRVAAATAPNQERRQQHRHQRPLQDARTTRDEQPASGFAIAALTQTSQDVEKGKQEEAAAKQSYADKILAQQDAVRQRVIEHAGLIKKDDTYLKDGGLYFNDNTKYKRNVNNKRNEGVNNGGYTDGLICA